MELWGWAAVTLEELGAWGAVWLKEEHLESCRCGLGSRVVTETEACPWAFWVLLSPWRDSVGGEPCQSLVNLGDMLRWHAAKGKEQGSTVMISWKSVGGCLATYFLLPTSLSLTVYIHRGLWCCFRWCFWVLLLFLDHGLNALSTAILYSQFSCVLGLKPVQPASALLYCFSRWLGWTFPVIFFFFLILVKIVFSLTTRLYCRPDFRAFQHGPEYYVLSPCFILSRTQHAEIGNTSLFVPPPPRECPAFRGWRVHTHARPFFSFSSFVQGFMMQPWLAWNSLCSLGWPQVQKSTHFCLPNAGLKICTTKPDNFLLHWSGLRLWVNQF